MAFMSIKHANEDFIFYRVETVGNAVFTVVFGVEAFLKIAGLGFRQYFSAPWNIFDFALAVAGAASAIASVGSVGILLRISRALRILRLIQFSPNLQVHAAYAASG